MPNKKDNRELYEKILATAITGSEPIGSTDENGYECVCGLGLYNSNKQPIGNFTFWENETKVYLVQGSKSCENEDGDSYTIPQYPSLTLPSWLDYFTGTGIYSGYGVISGTAPNYEDIELAEYTNCGTFNYTVNYSMGLQTGENDPDGSCNGTFLIAVYDVNEPPTITDISSTICSNDVYDGLQIGTITITDPDIKTQEYSHIEALTVNGPISEFVDINFSKGLAPITASVTLKNTENIGTAPTNPLTGEIVVHSEYSYYNCPQYYLRDHGNRYATGNISLDIIDSLFFEYPDKLGNLRTRRGSKNNHLIPTGLSLSKPIFLGYYGTSDGPGCASSCNSDNNNYARITFAGNSVGGSSDIEVTDFILHHDFKNYFGVQIEQNRLNNSSYTGNFRIDGTGIYDTCCAPEGLDFSVIETQNTDGIAVVKTGIGPDIDFTGGIGNVEGAYFIGGLYDDYPSYSLRNKLAIIPNTSGIGFDSQDSAFYLYTFGVTGVEEIAHVSETGIIEADGFDKYIAIRYKSSSANTFYVYNIENDTFTTGISPFSSDIKRLIGLHHPISNQSINKFWVLGNDESVLYDPTTDTYSSVNHNQFVGSSGIPENISVVSTRKFLSCIEELQGGENYVFAVGTGYDGSNDYFPVVLQGNDLVPHTDSSYISGISLSGYYLDNYLNYRTDIVQNLHRLIISAENTGLNQTQLLACDMDRSGEMSIVAKSSSTQRHKRVSELINNLILWAGDSASSETIAVNTFGGNPLVYYDTLDITGEISIVKPNYNQYTTMLLAEGGESGYIVSDYDLNVTNRLSFDGSLDMGKYGDISLATGLAGSPNGIGGKPNYLLLPQTTYETNTISGSLVAISTTTTARLDIIFSTGINDWNLNETVVVGRTLSFDCGEGDTECCGSDWVTPSAITIGTFIVTDDEFDGGNTLGLPEGTKDNDIFILNLTGNSGSIQVKSCIGFDYETKNTYTGVISGVDPYFIDQPPFYKEFVLNINDVDEPPTSIDITPNTLTVASNIDLSSDFLVANIDVNDQDIEVSDNFLNNIVEIADGVNKQYFRVSSDYTQLFLRKDSVLQSEKQYTITLIVRGYNFSSYTASATFTLNVAGHAPIGIFMDPIRISINENTPLPSLRHLAKITLDDPDSTEDNEIILTGPDATYFTILYTGITNTGDLYLNPNPTVNLDFETKSSYTGTLLARIRGTTAPTVTTNFIINVLDVDEPTGIIFNPNIAYIDETDGTQQTLTYISTLSLTEPFLGENLIITDLAYTTGGYRSALDRFNLSNAGTSAPDLVLLPESELDYESEPEIFIIASGYPEGSPNVKLGGLITIIVNDVDEPPIVSLNPTGLSINETTDTSLGRFKLADINVQDEKQSQLDIALIGDDAEYFTIVPSSIVVDSPSSSINAGTLYFNSGVSLNFDIKNTYTGQVLVIDDTGLSSTGIFILDLNDVGDCFLDVTGEVSNPTCPADTDGFILINMSYSGDGADVCTLDRPLSVDWKNLPTGAAAPGDGSYLYNIGTGTYTANILGGTVPLREVSFDVTSSISMEITKVTINQIPCENTGSITIAFTGGLPPYVVEYDRAVSILPSGSAQVTTINIDGSSSENIRIIDANNCFVTGGPYLFQFPSNSIYNFEEQSPPLIHDDVLSSYKFNITHGSGPYDINIYNSNSGEKGEFVTSIDRYDTSVILGVSQVGQETTDESGNIQTVISNDLFVNPLIYSYDIGSKIYPGSYVFEFLNQDNCLFLTELQTASNIQPLSADIVTVNDLPVDLGQNVISQPILDTLFIPYNLIVRDSSVLSYISNITEKTDIRFQIGDQIYDRNALYGSLRCEEYSVINIKFLGIDSKDWYFTIPFYKGFDISSNEVDILNQEIFLVLSENKKIKIVTELNNNTNTIKLLKGSLLTTDGNIAQFKNDKEIELSYYDPETELFEKVAEAKIGDIYTLHNKHIPNNILMLDVLKVEEITENLNSDTIETVSFDCKTNLKKIAEYRNFIIRLNNFDNYENIYFKTKNNFIHNGSISLNIAGGYTDNFSYSIEYKYYNQETKKLQDLKQNNSILRDSTTLLDLKNGTYILKIKDIYNNKIKSINNINYDVAFSHMVDYIKNNLNTTQENLEFKYGDILVTIYNNLLYNNSGGLVAVPGTEPSETTESPTIQIVEIQTSTHKVSPNSSYTNKILIQTNPGKTKFVVTGPYGYKKIFDDRTELIQIPPGVYNIEGYGPDLKNKYLFQDKRKLFINQDTEVFVDLSFELYQDQLIIE